MWNNQNGSDLTEYFELMKDQSLIERKWFIKKVFLRVCKTADVDINWQEVLMEMQTVTVSPWEVKAAVEWGCYSSLFLIIWTILRPVSCFME